jgi:hypothetical protein
MVRMDTAETICSSENITPALEKIAEERTYAMEVIAQAAATQAGPLRQDPGPVPGEL